MNRDDAFKFQEKILKPLSDLSYLELERLVGRKELDSPKGLEEFNFAQEIKKDEFGGLEVSVFHYYPPDENLIPTELLKILDLEGNRIKLGESKYCSWFNISKNNKVEWPDTNHYDGDD